MITSTFFLVLSFIIFLFFLFFYVRRPILRSLDLSINSIKEEFKSLEGKKNFLHGQLARSQIEIKNIDKTLDKLKAETETFIKEQETDFLAKKDKIEALYNKKKENEIAKIETHFIEEISTIISTKLILILKEITLKEEANKLLIERLRDVIKK